MILTADSGSTKCHWALVEGESASNEPKIIETRGINPVTCSSEQVKEIIAEGLLPQIKATEVEGICFYGAGCITNAPATLELQRTLQEIFPQATTIVVATDMLGAAHALCGHDKGIVCILGTGSNSAFYDGEQLAKNVPPLGYILGDEGGGANLGKTFVSNALKGLMPSEIVDLMYEECQTSYAQIIESVYRKPNANRYLASFVPFMARHRDRAEIRRCIDLAFDNFIERNLLQYPDVEKLPINFVGSIAAVFEQELTEALSRHSLTLGKIERSPIGGMVKYHTTL
jgi:N-acetylglucosamine kinase-like BadF-type ATPase